MAAVVLAGCGGTASTVGPAATATQVQQLPAAATKSLELPTDLPASEGESGMPADIETYYKTMVFIEGTAQLMAKLDLASLSNDSTGFFPLIAMPGIMDDRVIATEQTPLPDGLAPSWAKAVEAHDGIQQAFETLLMTTNQDNFLAQIGASLALASEAVSEAEAIAVSDFGATAESVALANRAALTEMGEAYQQFASMILVGQSQADDGAQ
jgi:hypothetical protein